MLALGETHLNYLIREWPIIPGTAAPRARPPTNPAAGEPDPPVLPFPERGVVCERRLGGLLRHYRRAA
jgi:hypothetical protein